MTIPITQEVINRLTKMGFQHTWGPASRNGYDYSMTYGSSPEEKALGITFRENRAGNPALFMFSRFRSKSDRAVESFGSMEEILEPAFDRAFVRVLLAAQAEVEKERAREAAEKARQAARLAEARKLGDALRALGMSVDISASTWEGTINGVSARVVFQATETGGFKASLQLLVVGRYSDGIAVGQSVAGEPVLVAEKACHFLADIEAAK